MTYLLYNPLANNSKGEQDAGKWAYDNNVECEYVSLLDIKDMKEFFDGLKELPTTYTATSSKFRFIT